MNGPQHCLEAERLLAGASALIQQGAQLTAQGIPASEAMVLFTGSVLQAQTHAVLALAAATAASRTAWANPADNYTATYVDGDGWAEVTK